MLTARLESIIVCCKHLFVANSIIPKPFEDIQWAENMSAETPVSVTPAELKAIEEHKYYISLSQGGAVSIDEAIRDWVQNHREQWLQEKQRHDSTEQIKEIEMHKWYRSEEAGFDVGRSTASQEWIILFARDWREAKESLESNGFHTTKVILAGQEGAGESAWNRLVGIALSHDCDVYVYWSEMSRCSFILNGKGFLDMKAPCFSEQIKETASGEIDVIAIGAEAGAVIKSIEDLQDAKKAADEECTQVGFSCLPHEFPPSGAKNSVKM
jgi:hypothetical protein